MEQKKQFIYDKNESSYLDNFILPAANVAIYFASILAEHHFVRNLKESANYVHRLQAIIANHATPLFG